MYGYNLIFVCYMLNREMINYSGVQLFKALSKHFPKPLCENAAQALLIKVLLLKGVWISRLKVQNVIYWSYYFDNLNFMK